jgi:peptide/nickel transport system substrate-binding protein
VISMKHSADPRRHKSEPTDFIRTTVRRREFITGSLAAGGLVLAGCGSSGSSSGTSSTGLSLISLTDVIARGFDRDGPNTDPGFAEANYNTFDGLVAYPQPLTDGAFVPNFSADIDQFVPLLAVSWTQQSPKVWVVKLRQGVKSAAGNELTSADVVYTFARAKSVSGSAPNSWFLANVGGILGVAPVLPKAPPSAKVLTNEVVAVDKYTVQFNLFQDTGRLFMVALADTNLTIFDSVEMKKHATASDPWSHTWGNQNCAGFGPYTITTYKPGTQIVYQARPNYYRAAPKYTRVITSAVPEAGSRVAALKVGQAQIAEYLDPADLASLKGDSSVNLVGSYTNDIAFICLNYSYPPWNLPTNRLLRQAVAYSIPYDDIVNLDYLGFARRMYSQIPSTFDGYLANMTYQTDLTKAKALLAQAGFPGGTGLDRYSSGLQFYYVAERASLLEPVANRIKTNLASIGVTITLQPLPQSEFASRQLQTGNMPMSLFDFSSPSVPTTAFVTKLLYQTPSTGGLVDPTHYSNKAFDAMSAQAQTASGATLASLTTQMQNTLMNDLPTIPLVEVRPVLAMAKPLTGWYQVLDATVPEYYYVTS